MNGAMVNTEIDQQNSLLNRAKAVIDSIVETLDHDPETDVFRALRLLSEELEKLDSRVSALESEL